MNRRSPSPQAQSSAPGLHDGASSHWSRTEDAPTEGADTRTLASWTERASRYPPPVAGAPQSRRSAVARGEKREARVMDAVLAKALDRGPVVEAALRRTELVLRLGAGEDSPSREQGGGQGADPQASGARSEAAGTVGEARPRSVLKRFPASSGGQQRPDPAPAGSTAEGALDDAATPPKKPAVRFADVEDTPRPSPPRDRRTRSIFHLPQFEYRGQRPASRAQSAASTASAHSGAGVPGTASEWPREPAPTGSAAGPADNGADSPLLHPSGVFRSPSSRGRGWAVGTEAGRPESRGDTEHSGPESGGDSVSGDEPRPVTSLTGRTEDSGAVIRAPDSRHGRDPARSSHGHGGADFDAMAGDQSLRSDDAPPSRSSRSPSRASQSSRSPPGSQRRRRASSRRAAPPGVTADPRLLQTSRPWTTGAGAPSMSLRERYMTQAERAARARAAAAHEEEVKEADAALEARREQVYASLQEQAMRRQQRPQQLAGPGVGGEWRQRQEDAQPSPAAAPGVHLQIAAPRRTARPRRRMRRPPPTPRSHASWEDDASVLRAYTRGALATLPGAPASAAGGGMRRAVESAHVSGDLPMVPAASRLEGQLRSARAQERITRRLMAEGILSLRQHLPQELLLSTFMQRLIQERGETFLRRILARAVNGYCADAMRRWEAHTMQKRHEEQCTAATRIKMCWRRLLVRRRVQDRVEARAAREAALARRLQRARKRKNHCATQIQRVWRGSRGRKRASGVRRRHEAATRIQRWLQSCWEARGEGEAARRRALGALAMQQRAQRREDAALTVQRVWRGHRTRWRALLLRRWRRVENRREQQARWHAEQQLQLQEHGAAVALQRFWRRCARMKRLRLRQRALLSIAPVRIQRLWRGHAVRAAVGPLLEERKAAALRLQMAFRGWQARRVEAEAQRLFALMDEVEKDKRKKRGKRTLASVTALGAGGARRALTQAARRVDPWSAKKEARAATLLQARWRGVLARREIAKVRRARRRMAQARAQRGTGKQVAVMQAAWRGFWTRRSIVREHRRWAALTLQRHWRGILCRLDRREQREKRDAAHVILRAWRRFYFRQGPGHKPVRVADVARHACTLQTATRAWLARRRVHKLRSVTRFLAESQAACEASIARLDRDRVDVALCASMLAPYPDQPPQQPRMLNLRPQSKQQQQQQGASRRGRVSRSPSPASRPDTAAGPPSLRGGPSSRGGQSKGREEGEEEEVSPESVSQAMRAQMGLAPLPKGEGPFGYDPFALGALTEALAMGQWRRRNVFLWSLARARRRREEGDLPALCLPGPTSHGGDHGGDQGGEAEEAREKEEEEEEEDGPLMSTAARAAEAQRSAWFSGRFPLLWAEDAEHAEGELQQLFRRLTRQSPIGSGLSSGQFDRFLRGCEGLLEEKERSRPAQSRGSGRTSEGSQPPPPLTRHNARQIFASCQRPEGDLLFADWLRALEAVGRSKFPRETGRRKDLPGAPRRSTLRLLHEYVLPSKQAQRVSEALQQRVRATMEGAAAVIQVWYRRAVLARRRRKGARVWRKKERSKVAERGVQRAQTLVRGERARREALERSSLVYVQRRSAESFEPYWYNALTGRTLQRKPRTLRTTDVPEYEPPSAEDSFVARCCSCGDARATRYCGACLDPFCDACFPRVHVGSMRDHGWKPIRRCALCVDQTATRVCDHCTGVLHAFAPFHKTVPDCGNADCAHWRERQARRSAADAQRRKRERAAQAIAGAFGDTSAPAPAPSPAASPARRQPRHKAADGPWQRPEEREPSETHHHFRQHMHRLLGGKDRATCVDCGLALCHTCFAYRHRNPLVAGHSFTPVVLLCQWCATRPAQQECRSCEMLFCRPCFAAQHAKGTRASHTPEPVPYYTVERRRRELAERRRIQTLERENAIKRKRRADKRARIERSVTRLQRQFRTRRKRRREAARERRQRLEDRKAEALERQREALRQSAKYKLRAMLGLKPDADAMMDEAAAVQRIRASMRKGRRAREPEWASQYTRVCVTRGQYKESRGVIASQRPSWSDRNQQWEVLVFIDGLDRNVTLPTASVREEAAEGQEKPPLRQRVQGMVRRAEVRYQSAVEAWNDLRLAMQDRRERRELRYLRKYAWRERPEEEVRQELEALKKEEASYSIKRAAAVFLRGSRTEGGEGRRKSRTGGKRVERAAAAQLRKTTGRAKVRHDPSKPRYMQEDEVDMEFEEAEAEAAKKAREEEEARLKKEGKMVYFNTISKEVAPKRPDAFGAIGRLPPDQAGKMEKRVSDAERKQANNRERRQRARHKKAFYQALTTAAAWQEVDLGPGAPEDAAKAAAEAKDSGAAHDSDASDEEDAAASDSDGEGADGDAAKKGAGSGRKSKKAAARTTKGGFSLGTALSVRVIRETTASLAFRNPLKLRYYDPFAERWGVAEMERVVFDRQGGQFYFRVRTLAKKVHYVPVVTTWLAPQAGAGLFVAPGLGSGVAEACEDVLRANTGIPLPELLPYLPSTEERGRVFGEECSSGELPTGAEASAQYLAALGGGCSQFPAYPGVRDGSGRMVGMAAATLAEGPRCLGRSEFFVEAGRFEPKVSAKEVSTMWAVVHGDSGWNAEREGKQRERMRWVGLWKPLSANILFAVFLRLPDEPQLSAEADGGASKGSGAKRGARSGATGASGNDDLEGELAAAQAAREHGKKVDAELEALNELNVATLHLVEPRMLRKDYEGYAVEPMLAVEASVDQRYALQMNKLLAERDRMKRAKERREKLRQEKEEEKKKKKKKGKGKSRAHGAESSSSDEEETGRSAGRGAKKGKKGGKKKPKKQINKMNLRHSK